MDEDPNDDRLCVSRVNICAPDSGGNLSCGRKAKIGGLTEARPRVANPQSLS